MIPIFMSEKKINPEYIPYGLVIPLITPLHKAYDGRGLTVDEISVGSLIDHLNPYADWLFVGGSAGEFDRMSTWTRIMLFNHVANNTPQRLRRIAHVSSTTIEDMVRCTKAANYARYQGVSLNLLYGEGKPAEKVKALTKATDKPITIYEIPEKQGGHTLDPKKFGTLFLNHPQIVAIKVSSKDPKIYEQWLSYVPQGLAVLSGSVTLAESVINSGATGIVPIAANVRPDRFLWDQLTNEDGLVNPKAMQLALDARRKYDSIKEVKSALQKAGIIHTDRMFY